MDSNATEHAARQCRLNRGPRWIKPLTQTLARLPDPAGRYRILCSPNHYGDQCSKFCRAHDDESGHYTCGRDGQKLCTEGWQGPDCNRAKCSAGCNNEYGFCEQPDTCQCKPGWTGPRCDECRTHPNCKNGFCQAPWQCMCRPYWAGQYCDSLDYCALHAPCENNATCHNVAPGRYECQCPRGFMGLNCHLRLTSLVDLSAGATRAHGCAQNPCLNGGTCLRASQQLASAPKADNQPPQIEEDNLESANRWYRCQCPAGYRGDYCQWAEQTPRTNESLPTQPSSNNEAASQTASDSELVASLSTPAGLLELDTILAPMSFDPPGGRQTSGELLVHETPRSPGLQMRHLISGVIVASTIGVFFAALLLAWCCLFAIERGKFQLLQMNFIRGEELETVDESHGFASSLRRVQAKIRNSFRRSSSIKPATKLSLENVLNPTPRLAPPTYEESNRRPCKLEEDSQLRSANANHHQQRLSKQQPRDDLVVKPSTTVGQEQLVRCGAIEREMALKLKAGRAKGAPPRQAGKQFRHDPASCPKHGHLYRTHRPNSDTSTKIEIEYKPPDTRI